MPTRATTAGAGAGADEDADADAAGTALPNAPC